MQHVKLFTRNIANRAESQQSSRPSSRQPEKAPSTGEGIDTDSSTTPGSKSPAGAAATEKGDSSRLEELRSSGQLEKYGFLTAPAAADSTANDARPADADDSSASLSAAAVQAGALKTTHKLKTVVVPPPNREWHGPSTGKVIKVYDGDTPTIETENGSTYSIRCGAGNTLEMRGEPDNLEPYSKQAQKEAAKLLFRDYPNDEDGREVRLIYLPGGPEREGYGRLLARVEVDIEKDGKKQTVDLTEHMIARGLSFVYLFADDSWPPEYLDRLKQAQAKARSQKLGFWKEPQFQRDLLITSFHANGRGFDPNPELVDDDGKAFGRRVDPNIEYFRVANITDKPINLEGYTVTNAAGEEFTLPPATIKPGHQCKIMSGKQPVYRMRAAPSTHYLYLGSNKPIWNNFADELTITDPSGEVVAKKQHAPQSYQDWSELPEVITSTQLRRAGSDVVKEYIYPEAFVHTPDQIGYDDGDTHYIPLPEDGSFKVKINGQGPIDVIMEETGEADNGYFGVRYFGADTLETKYRTTQDGRLVYASQGPAAEWAKKELSDLLHSAKRIITEPIDAKNPLGYYGRLLANIKAVVNVKGDDGKIHEEVIDVNKWLIRKGAAVMSYSYYNAEPFHREEFEAFRKASKYAYEHRLGIYSDDEDKHMYELPTAFRKRCREEIRPTSMQLNMYVADYETGLVYDADKSLDAVPPYNRIWIMRRDLNLALTDDSFTTIDGQPFEMASKAN